MEEMNKEKIIEKKVAEIKLIGKTLYLTIQTMPQERGIFRSGGYSNITIVVPEGIEVITSSGETL